MMYERAANLAKLLLVAAFFLSSATGSANAQASFDRAAWQADFDQLKSAMSDHYANLEWAVERRGIDLPALSAETVRRLETAQTELAARHAFELFVAAFGDGHFVVRWPPDGASGSAPQVSEPQAPQSLCQRLGFREAQPTVGIEFARMSGYRRLDNEASRYFAANVIETRNGRIGTIRIAQFDEHAFPELCEQAAAALGHAPEAPCGDGCAGPVEREAGNLLLAKLDHQLTALQAEGIRALVVDITGNGGGSNWVGPATRLFTARRITDSRQGFIRHPHWARQLDDRLSRARLEATTVEPAYRPLLGRAIAAFEMAAADANTGCDRSALWRGERPACTLLSFAGPLYAAGVVPYAQSGTPPQGVTCCYLFGPQRWRYREGAYAGPLYVLVDRGTASAAEYFTALLVDSGAATVIGAPTYGAGCGYTNGGISTTLQNSGGQVRMPDCVRLRADGSNEVEGITPNILVPWRGNDSAAQRARRLEAVLPQLAATRR